MRRARAGAVSKFASMLAYIFTPLFASMLVVFLVAVPTTGRSIEGEREALILFNVLLGFVVGLLLFYGAARRQSDRPGFFDGAATVLAAAGLRSSSSPSRRSSALREPQHLAFEPTQRRA